MFVCCHYRHAIADAYADDAFMRAAVLPHDA